MTIVELSRVFDWTRFDTYESNTIVWVNHSPGVWYASFDGEFGITEEDFWITNEAIYNVNYVISVLVDYRTLLDEQTSIADVENNDGSYFWDVENRLLYIAIEGFDSPDTHEVSVGKIQGFTDQEVIYVDDLLYSPLVQNIPNLSKKQDLENYDKLSFISGVIELLNTGGDLDNLVRDVVYGNSIYVGIIRNENIDADNNAVRSSIEYLAALYVEDYNVGLQTVSIQAQDLRKSQNIPVPTETFDKTTYPDLEDNKEGNTIPLAYGPIREIPAIPVTGAQSSGDVTFRAAVELTSFGTIQTLQDGTWVTVSPSSTDASKGEFVLSESDARNTSGTIFDCKLVDCEGISITYSSDIIKDLFDRYSSVPYNDSNYDTSEWEQEETSLSTIGMLFDDSVEMFEAIRRVQSESNVGFRFEFLPSGLRTLRIDDWSRDDSFHVYNTDIQSILGLEVETDAELLAAEVLVKFDRSYVVDDDFLKLLDVSQRDRVLAKYRQQPRLTKESSVVTLSDAQEKATFLIERFSDIHGVAEVTLMGKEYLDLRLLDVGTIELNPGTFDLDEGTIESDRQYYGLQRAQVISIDPDYESSVNTVRLVLIEEETFDEYEYTQGWLLKQATLRQRVMGDTHRRLVQTRSFSYI